MLFNEVGSNFDTKALEYRILQFWEENKIFDKRCELQSGSPRRYSFIDGPITANNPMGVHTAWGRSLKDLIQRYWAMKGYHERYQNGFDCQGLWVEVEVEKALGLNSKRAIENFGLERFAQKCKQRVEKYAKLITEQSKRLGQWMDWENSYYTHTDTNISYIWHFLKVCHEKGWIVKGYSPMPWCTRCGTSLSQHELHGSYEELTHTAIYVKFPIVNHKEKREDNKQMEEYLLVWTTTPWTLTANTAVAVNPGLTYCKVKQGKELLLLTKGRLSVLQGSYEVLEEAKGEELVGLEYQCPFDFLSVQKDIVHRVIDWDEVGEDEGTGLVHIAPGCGAEDYELSKVHGLKVLSPIDESGIFVEGFSFFTGMNVKEASKRSTENLEERGLLYVSEEYTHRYPACWRCHKELVFRLVDEWFIDCNEIRPLLKSAAKKVEWIPSFYGKRMQDWLNNMGNWCISRKRFWGLPLPFFECSNCGELTVVGSKDELFELAVEGLGNLQELHRPWIDDVKINCPKCGSLVPKVTEVGDCWLDAGIVPFSTLKYLTDQEYWDKWFPADCICEMREQIRLWFYSQLFMSVALIGKAPYKRVVIHEKVHDKDGRPMHRSWGNTIWFDDAIEKLGADIMRWAYAKQPLTQTMNFGFQLEDEVKPFFLTLWNAYSFFATFANLDGFNPTKEGQKKQLSPVKRPLFDRWLLSKLNQLTLNVRKNLERANFRQVTKELEQFVEQLSTWYIRRSRRRFWKDEQSEEKASGYLTLYETLLTLCKLMAPIVPFLTEELYQNLTRKLDPSSPQSVHLCSYPRVKKALIDQKLNEKMDAVLEVVSLGRSARSKANLRVRQPLTRITVWCKEPKNIEALKELKKDLLEELNVKKLQFVTDPGKLFRYHLKPNYEVLGPKLRDKLPLLEEKLLEIKQVKVMKFFNQQMESLEVVLNKDTPPLKLRPQEDLKLEIEPVGSFAVAVGNSFAVALETELTEELIFEGLARDIVRQIQNLRKKSGFRVEDQIITYFEGGEMLMKAVKMFKEYIQTETLSKALVSSLSTLSEEDELDKRSRAKQSPEEKITLHGEEFTLRLVRVEDAKDNHCI